MLSKYTQFFILTIISNSIIFAYHCDPTKCPLLCCSSDDQCSSFTSSCVRSSCSQTLCPTGCCINGRCGSDAECSNKKSTTHIIAWCMLIAICLLITLFMCIYYIYEKYLRSRGRVQIPEVQKENHNVLQNSPAVKISLEQEKSQQNQIELTKNKLFKQLKSEATTSDMTVEPKDLEFVQQFDGLKKISFKLSGHQNFQDKNLIIEKLNQLNGNSRQLRKSLTLKDTMTVRKNSTDKNTTFEEFITENPETKIQLTDNTCLTSDCLEKKVLPSNNHEIKEQLEQQQQLQLQQSEGKDIKLQFLTTGVGITNFSFTKPEPKKEAKMEELSPLPEEKEDQYEEKIEQISYARLNEEFQSKFKEVSDYILETTKKQKK